MFFLTWGKEPILVTCDYNGEMQVTSYMSYINIS